MGAADSGCFIWTLSDASSEFEADSEIALLVGSGRVRSEKSFQTPTANATFKKMRWSRPNGLLTGEDAGG
jgi:hypothetical protein